MSEKTIQTDAYGDVTEEQWALYRERNVTPSEHYELQDIYGHGEAARDLILAAVREHTRDGRYDSFNMARAAQRRGLI